MHRYTYIESYMMKYILLFDNALFSIVYQIKAYH